MMGPPQRATSWAARGSQARSRYSATMLIRDPPKATVHNKLCHRRSPDSQLLIELYFTFTFILVYSSQLLSRSNTIALSFALCKRSSMEMQKLIIFACVALGRWFRFRGRYLPASALVCHREGESSFELDSRDANF